MTAPAPRPIPEPRPEPQRAREEVKTVTVLPEQHMAALVAERLADAEARNRVARLRAARRWQRRADTAARRARLAWLAVY